MATGEISYATPHDGKSEVIIDYKLVVYSVLFFIFRCRLCNLDWVQSVTAGLDGLTGVCSYKNGYHGIASYNWEKDGEDLDEEFPLLYTKATGKYHCVVTVPTATMKATKDFEIKGICEFQYFRFNELLLSYL